MAARPLTQSMASCPGLSGADPSAAIAYPYGGARHVCGTDPTPSVHSGAVDPTGEADIPGQAYARFRCACPLRCHWPSATLRENHLRWCVCRREGHVGGMAPVRTGRAWQDHGAAGQPYPTTVGVEQALCGV